jgi:hypothetical protein
VDFPERAQLLKQRLLKQGVRDDNCRNCYSATVNMFVMTTVEIVTL